MCMEQRPHNAILATESKQMKYLQPTNVSYRIARRAVKQGARPVKPPQVTVEKIDTEKSKKSELPKLLKANKVLIFGTLNT